MREFAAFPPYTPIIFPTLVGRARGLLRRAPQSNQVLLLLTDPDAATPATYHALTKLCDYAYLTGVGALWVNSADSDESQAFDHDRGAYDLQGTQGMQSRTSDDVTRPAPDSLSERATDCLATSTALTLLAASAYLRESGVTRIATLYVMSRRSLASAPSFAEAQATLVARYAQLSVSTDASARQRVRRLLAATTAMRATTDMLRGVAYLAPAPLATASPVSRRASPVSNVASPQASDPHDPCCPGSASSALDDQPLAPFGVAAPAAAGAAVEIWRTVRALYHWLMRTTPITPNAPMTGQLTSAMLSQAQSTDAPLERLYPGRREQVSALIDHFAAAAALRAAMRRSKRLLNEEWAAVRAGLPLDSLDAYGDAPEERFRWRTSDAAGAGGRVPPRDGSAEAITHLDGAWYGDATPLERYASGGATSADDDDIHTTLRQARAFWPQLDARAKQRWAAAWAQALAGRQTEQLG